MKFLRTGLAVAMVGLALSAVPGTPSLAAAPTTPRAANDDPSLRTQMRSDADGSVRISTQRATGKVGFVAARGRNADLMPDVAGGNRAAAADKATAYLEQYGAAFGLGRDQLRQVGVTPNRYGTTVRYTQQYRGLPVFGTGFKANVDKAGNLTAIAGYAAPDLNLSVDPRLSAAQAAERAVGFVKADPPTSESGGKADTTGVKAATNTLSVYRIGALKGEPGAAVLTYVVEVTNRDNVRDMVFVDANTGKPVNRYSMIADGLERELREASGTAQAPTFETVWEEGDDFPGDLNQDQQNLIQSSGESYWLFENTFGRDSYDGEGAERITVNNDPRINCPNANWNGVTTNYCDGVTSDDVVSHEWGHAYTEYTSGLIYQYQSGALNESYSDVWGETLDLLNNREDEDEGDITVKRPDGECDPTAPPTLEVDITAPAGVAGPCTARAAGFGPAYTTTPVTTDVVVAQDAANTTGPSTTDGCTAYTNQAAVTGKYAFVDRGTCTFQAKIDIAQAAGATGLVIGNNAAGLPPSPAGTATIPGFAITQSDGNRVKSAGTVTMRIAAEDISARTPSTRWLIGEKSEAFGGAIRDMWNPTCYGNPGKVTDAEYNCDPLLTDSGGVHGNSGVPNHAYALLVDGGAYNGQTISGIGIDKAANIWWRAQTAYLIESSDFEDAADAFEQSCTDLIGEDINKVTIGTSDTGGAAETPELADPITAADCTQVANTMAATEMRKPVTQCNFQPLLAPGSLSACGNGTVTETTVLDDFEDGLGAWTADFQLATGATEHFPWEASTDAPAGREGGVAYGPDPDAGSCAPNEDDISSRDSIISPEITVPAGQTPRVSVDHYVATEPGYDGGNVKVSLNGGPFTTVPASAYLFNPYNATMATSATNTSPLAGQPGFTGTDGGEVTGSWGQSTISVAKLGAVAGDKIKVRFDFGRDGCGGNDGWYLDNLVMTVCKRVAAITAVHNPNPSAYRQPSTVDVTAPAGATGTVTLVNGGKDVGSAELADGEASIPVPTTLGAGTYNWTVEYSGDGAYAAAEKPVRATIAKGTTSLVITQHPATVKQGRTATVKVKISSPSGAPNTGPIALKSGGALYGTGKISGGVATITTRKLTKVGTLNMIAIFSGNPNYAGSRSAPVTIKVVK